MGVFEDVDDATKKKIVKVWGAMDEKNKDFFMGMALSVAAYDCEGCAKREEKFSDVISNP